MENEIRYADLFGGVGGFRKGIEQSGANAKCVFYSDIDKYSVQTYNKNFKENHKPTDITKIRTDDIPEIDMLCGGFPCQAFSIAGKRRGFNDTRGILCCVNWAFLSPIFNISERGLYINEDN